jgi:predicted dehydrogenase
VIGIGVIGAGYWGPKHIRNYSEIPGAQVAMVADLSEARLAAIHDQYPTIRTTTNFQELLHDPEVAAVVIATPVSTHAKLADEALRAGKHVMVEKPLAATSIECEQLIRVAAERNRVLMVGHTFMYNPAVLALREVVQSGAIGDICYAHAERLNLGLFQRDINVLWDLAPHDLSILMYVLDSTPTSVAARGAAHFLPKIEDTAYMEVAFPGQINADVHVSWLDPNKVRSITLVGSKKMVVFDDCEPVEKIRLFDRGVDLPADGAGGGQPVLSYRSGGISPLPVAANEPLRLECEHFLECIRTGARPRSDGEQGMLVVQALEAANLSLASDGAKVAMPSTVTRPFAPAQFGSTQRTAVSDLSLLSAAGD